MADDGGRTIYLYRRAHLLIHNITQHHTYRITSLQCPIMYVVRYNADPDPEHEPAPQPSRPLHPLHRYPGWTKSESAASNPSSSVPRPTCILCCRTSLYAIR